jgi:hypothetical protein
MDVYTLEEHRAHDIRAIEMHYINEIGPGDVLQLQRKGLTEGTHYIDGIRKADGVPVFCSLIEWM